MLRSHYIFMKIKINFEDTYEPLTVSEDLKQMIFPSPQRDGTQAELLIKISTYQDIGIPRIYNLGFGPPDGNGEFDDNISLAHQDYNKMFSTILFHAYVFLNKNPELTLGIDGSDDRRAAVYHKMYINNKDYLEEYFEAIGVDWYVRVFRNWEYEKDEHDNLLPKPRPEAFNYERSWHDLYRYYMFKKKQ